MVHLQAHKPHVPCGQNF